jgi:hypothetical protein
MDDPNFDNLMSDPYLAPRQRSVLTHNDVVRNAVEWLENRGGWLVETEVDLPGRSLRPDVTAWSPTEQRFLIIEAKASWSDFVRDRKFLRYRAHTNFLIFAMPEKMVPAARKRMALYEDAYDGIGILMVSVSGHFRRRLVRQAEECELTSERYYDMVERWAHMCRSRLFGARLEINNLRWSVEQAKDNATYFREKWDELRQIKK